MRRRPPDQQLLESVHREWWIFMIGTARGADVDGATFHKRSSKSTYEGFRRRLL